MLNVIAKDSQIHGRGLFAIKSFKNGDVILEWADCTRILDSGEIASLPTDERKYLSHIDGKYVLFLPPARFVNHSCNPNARGGDGFDVATRDISAGEEITVDYVVEQVPGLNLQCNCGASVCRGQLKVDAKGLFADQ